MDRISQLIENQTILQSNNSGPFIITKDLGKINGRRKVIVKFINTGYEYSVLAHNAIDHRVKDSSLESISMDFDIKRFDDYENYINGLLKQVYRHMIDRCYNINSDKYNSYGASGVYVCDEWVNDINIFLRDARSLPGFKKYYNAPYLYQLDKDYLQMHMPKNKRVYSKSTCMFLYYQDNYNLKIIDSQQNGLYGIEINSAGNFYTRIKINGHRINIGTFNNQIAAANAFNYWQLYFHNFELVPLLNNVPYMPPNEFIKYNVHTKDICKIVKI